MKDIFYDLLVIWVVWRIIDGLNAARKRTRNQPASSNGREGETTISYTPHDRTKKKSPDDGEYVDYEEIK